MKQGSNKLTFICIFITESMRFFVELFKSFGKDASLGLNAEVADRACWFKASKNEPKHN